MTIVAVIDNLASGPLATSVVAGFGAVLRSLEMPFLVSTGACFLLSTEILLSRQISKQVSGYRPRHRSSQQLASFRLCQRGGLATEDT